MLVIKVTEKENDALLNLNERMNALKELKVALDLQNEDEKRMYDEISSEIEIITTKCSKWWDEIFNKYKIENTKDKRYYIDFTQSSIFDK